FHALRQSVKQTGADVVVKRVGCVGMCHRTPMLEVVLPGKPSAVYAGLQLTDVQSLVMRHFRPRGFMRRAARLWTRALDGLLMDDPAEKVANCALDMREPAANAFLGRQAHIATENFGKIDPLNLDEYLAHGGFSVLARCLPAANQDRGAHAVEPRPVALPLPKGEGRGGGNRDRRPRRLATDDGPLSNQPSLSPEVVL